MKKTLTAAALSSVLVLGLAAASQAADAAATTGVNAAGASKVTLDGSVRQRGAYEKIAAAKDATGHSYYDTRAQLGVAAQVSPEASGYLKLETGAGNGDTEAWGSYSGTSSLTEGGDKLGGLNILEAWINYKPGDFGVKVGHMPLALGNKVFFDHTTSGDDAIVAYGDLNGGATHVGALTIKFNENDNDKSDDLNGYVALVTHKVSDTLKLGANWTYLRGEDSGAYTTAALVGNLGLGAGRALEIGKFPGLSMSNIGLTADGKVGAITYLADLEMQFGTAGETDNGNGSTYTIDASGWAAKLAGNYDLGGGKVGLVFGYGSGTDEQDMTNDLNDGNNDLSFDTYVNFLTDTTYDTVLAGFRAGIPGAGWGHNQNRGGRNSGLSNLTLFQLNGSTKTTCPLTGKDLSLFASASYMQLSEDMINYGTNKVNKVGTELDLIGTWALTPGLSYKVEAAYLFVGDVFETAAIGTGADPDDLMFLRHSLELKF